MPSTFIRVAIIAASLGLDTFAVAAGIGTRGLAPKDRLRVGFSFAFAEAFMTFVGSLGGRAEQALLGEASGYLGFAALAGVGAYMIYEALRDAEDTFDLTRGWGLVLASLSISLDALGIGFSIAYLHVPIAITLAAIFLASASAAGIGLSAGRSLGAKAGRNAGVIAGAILIATGLGFAWMHYARLGFE